MYIYICTYIIHVYTFVSIDTYIYIYVHMYMSISPAQKFAPVLFVACSTNPLPNKGLEYRVLGLGFRVQGCLLHAALIHYPIHMYTCIYTYMYAWMPVGTYIYIYICVYIHIFLCIYICVYVYIYALVVSFRNNPKPYHYVYTYACVHT